MLPHQERVIAEREELVMKVAKLEEFLFKDLYFRLPYEEQSRLMQQFGLMAGYLRVLDERIAAFGI